MTNSYEAVYTYTPWWYDDYEDEEESSLSSPILWGVGGLLLGALLMALILHIIRKKKQKHIPMNVPVNVPTMPDSREELLRKRAYATDDLLKPEVVPSEGDQMQMGFGAFPSAQNRLVEVRSAETIPGETMPMLAARLQSCLNQEGVAIDIKDVGKILATYTCCGGVRIVDTKENEPTLLKRASRALSEFFCASFPGSADIAPDYLPADASVPKHVGLVIKLSRQTQADRRPYGGINRETFRGILRETEEEIFFPEEDWKRVDALLSHYTGSWFMPERHLTIKNIESTCTCLLAVGAEPDEALDYALYQNLFLRIARKISRSGLSVMSEAFDELFKGRYMPLCRDYLEQYKPAPVETETPATENQTVDGGKYEPV
ncbi:MAG: hypothetical protein IK125_00130 [Lachnospiraceae bacterium]|nr:hypothetical protein [Lachnospiraceae bacterium]